MQRLLDFLLVSASRIYYFFGDLFTRAVDAARYALTWAIQEGGKALSAARDYALSLSNSIWAYVRRFEDNTLYWIDRLQDQIRQAAGPALDWIDGALSSIRQAGTAAIEELRGHVSSFLAGARAYFDDRLADLAGAIAREVAGVRADLNAWGPLLGRVAPLFTPRNETRLIDLLGRGYDALAVILADPGAWVRGHVETFILDSLQWALALAMGTTDRDLPVKPKVKG